MSKDDAYQKARDRILGAQRSNSATLDLTDFQIDEVPSEIGDLRSLKVLTLKKNRLTQLPSAIGKLSALQSLNLDGNELSALPPEIGKLVLLQNLSISNNKVEGIPIEAVKLRSLRKLNLSNNKLSQFPDAVTSLTALEHLNLSNNQLTSISPKVGGLSKLQVLRAGGNKLVSLPKEICNLARLKQLSLGNNKLQALPSNIKLLRSLDSLSVVDNQLSALPSEIGLMPKLRRLYLNSNKLREFPMAVCKLKTLELLTADGNPLKEPFPSLVKQGIDAVRDYLSAIERDGIQYFESRLILLGQPKAGKSCLRDLLIGRKYDPQRPETHGIEIEKFTVKHPNRPNTDISLKIWDFGGQQIYRATHQFFLSRRVLYLLLWDRRLDAEQHRVEGWLRLIRARVGSDARVIVVATYCLPPLRADWNQALLQKYHDIIVGQQEIDNSTGHGIEGLRRAIGAAASKLPQMGQPLSQAWIDTRTEVLRSPGERIPFETYERICQKHSITGTAIETLATLMSDVGDFLYFPTDLLLRSVVVLRPEWVTKALSLVLGDRAIAASGGIVKDKHLHGLLSRSGYAANDIPFFMQLMKQFEMLYQLPSQKEPESLVVQLVEQVAPKIPWPDALPGGMQERILCCSFDELPEGLMPWLTVRTRLYHTGLHWKNGVFLRYKGAGHESEALLTIDKLILTLRVRSRSPDFLYSVLRGIIEELIETSWDRKSISAQFFIPCPNVTNGQRCVGRFSITGLMFARQKQQENRQRIVMVPCSEHRHHIEITELLRGVEAPTISAEPPNDIGERLRQVLTLVTLMSSRVFPTPNVFTIRQEQRSLFFPYKFWGRPIRIILWCTHLEEAHPVSDASYVTTIPKKWFVEAAPYIKGMLKLLKIMPIMKGVIEGTDSQDFGVQLRILERISDLASSADETFGLDMPSLTAADEEVVNGNGSISSYIEYPGDRAVQALLLELDKARAFRPLAKVTTPYGPRWICPKHLDCYK
jgi:internalin A